MVPVVSPALRRLLPIVLCVLTLLTVTVTPAGADPDETEPTLPPPVSTTVPKNTTTTVPDDTNEDTGTTTTTSTTVPEEPPEGEVDEHADVDVEAPETDVTVPPRDPETIPTAVLEPEQVEAMNQAAEQAREDLAATELAIDMLDANIKTAQADLNVARRSLEQVSAEITVNAAAISNATTLVQNRAVDAYVAGDAPPDGLFSTDADLANEVLSKGVLSSTLLDNGVEALDRLYVEQTDLEQQAVDLRGTIDSLETEIKALDDEASELADKVGAFRFRADALSTITVHNSIGFVFPVAGPYRFSNDWGNPRSGGRSHKGTDIVAAHGTPLVAVERGVISRMSFNSLGGTSLWLKGESGTSYYYAHLVAYADDLAVGQVVDPGTLVGFVGDTGNAKGGVPHLHFQIHPGGGAPVNPYPLLAAVSKNDPNNERR